MNASKPADLRQIVDFFVIFVSFLGVFVLNPAFLD
jgi:hypothetical protein